jgi:Tfp pilus assembly protein PilF
MIMIPLRRTLMTCIFASVVVCAGCAGSGITSWSAASLWNSENSENKTAATPRGELPPKEAARACMAAAEELEKNGHNSEAIVLYEKARSKDAGLKAVPHHLAALYDAEGDSTHALEEYRKALELEPTNADLLNDFGYYCYERENYPEAEKTLKKAVAISPKHEKALANLALVLAAQSRFDESYETFCKVVGPAAAHSNVGVLQAKQGRNDDAKRSFQQALAADASLQQPKAFLAYLDRK